MAKLKATNQRLSSEDETKNQKKRTIHPSNLFTFALCKLKKLTASS